MCFSAQVGYDMSRVAAQKCFQAAGLKPSDVDVVELHDCFSANELITYEALGLCPEGRTTAFNILLYPPKMGCWEVASPSDPADREWTVSSHLLLKPAGV